MNQLTVIKLGEEGKWATTHRAKVRGVSWTVAHGEFSKLMFLIDLSTGRACSSVECSSVEMCAFSL